LYQLPIEVIANAVFGQVVGPITIMIENRQPVTVSHSF
jgi:hypothetical protein